MSTGRLEIRIEQACCTRFIGNENRSLVGPVSLEIHDHEFVSILGPAGCGKTTLLKMIAGILPATEGAIHFAGVEVHPPGRHFGLVLQHAALLPWRTVLQNIMLQAEICNLDPVVSRNRARRLMAWLGLTQFEESWPKDLPDGMSAAIAVCRAMIHNPSLLLMDGPFRTLDPLALERMLDGFQRLWVETGNTAVLCTSNMQEAVLLSDRVAVMSSRPGRILECIAIDLTRPRRLDKAMVPLLAEYCSRIRTLYRAQGILP
jgi:NitT/TauT family transport system ATP-binding protein